MDRSGVFGVTVRSLGLVGRHGVGYKVVELGLVRVLGWLESGDGHKVGSGAVGAS